MNHKQINIANTLLESINHVNDNCDDYEITFDEQDDEYLLTLPSCNRNEEKLQVTIYKMRDTENEWVICDNGMAFETVNTKDGKSLLLAFRDAVLCRGEVGLDKISLHLSVRFKMESFADKLFELTDMIHAAELYIEGFRDGREAK